eukprot:scaffold4691_cov97-Skeletonema_dohrnii-CCMP3373.AAC.2
MPVSTRSKIRTGSTRYLPTRGIFGRSRSTSTSNQDQDKTTASASNRRDWGKSYHRVGKGGKVKLKPLDIEFRAQ